MRKLFFLLLLLPFASCKNTPPNPTDLYAQYRSSVVLIQSAYYFKVTLPSGSAFFCTYNDDYPRFYDTEDDAKEGADISHGTGFFISDKGEIATNRHVVFPEDHTTMQMVVTASITDMEESLRLQISEMESGYEGDESEDDGTMTTAEEYEARSAARERERELRELRKQLAKFEGFSDESSNLRIEIKRTFLGVVFNDSRTAENNDFAECIAIANASEEAVDLAIIQLKTKKTPEAVTKVFALSDISKEGPKLNDPVYMIGFNAGVQLATTANGIKSQFTQGTITQDPDGMHLLYSIPTLPGSSGSPVFDKWGHLVAVNFAKMTQAQGFSFGIPAGKLQNLYNEKEYRARLVSSPAESSSGAPKGTKAPPDNRAVPTPVAASDEDAETRAMLTRFLAAEDDFDKIWGFFAKPPRRYYDLTTPDYESVYRRYAHIWEITRNNYNKLLDITRVAPDTYDLRISFSYYNIKKEEAFEKLTTVRAVVNNEGQITEIYGVE